MSLNHLGMALAHHTTGAVVGNLGKTPEDFVVEEVPLYTPQGEGEHCYFLVEKHNRTTLNVVNELATYLNIKEVDIGYAGLKDKNAITSQVISIRMTGKEPPEIKLKNCKIKFIGRHLNKIKIGHLKGNRFILTLENLEQGYAKKLEAKIDYIKKFGFPNYFGAQRFGNRFNNHLAGLSVLKKDYKQACFYLAGDSANEKNLQAKQAREFYENGEFQRAHDTFPLYFLNERKILKEIIKGENREKRAYLKCDRKTRELLFNALQSYLFNLYVTKRYEKSLEFIQGDVALLSTNLAPFIVEEPNIENLRLLKKEIMLSGPLYGYKMIRSQAEAANLEEDILQKCELSYDSFASPSEDSKFQGARRPLTTFAEDVAMQEVSATKARLSFFLPSGSYATIVLQEIFHKLAE